MNVDEAVGHALQALKEGTARKYGYDYYAPRVAQSVAARETHDHREIEVKTDQYYGFMEEAGWLLCLRGVLRPGVRIRHGQATGESGYSLTAAGTAKLQQLDDANVILYQSSALLNTFEGYKDRFGDGFVQRAAEAVRCRDAGVWLASCVMSGAAAEAVMLAVATAKDGDEDKVLRLYRGASGRRDIQNLITGQARQHLKDQMTAFSGIIAIWRDEAGHGASTSINTANADEALRQLLHMCQWAIKEWDALVS